MQPKIDANTTVWRVALKEINLFFATPIAYVFLATFAAITLFIFFWGESFFARNIADVRPLFEWMPILLIFLSATITMRLWSEEKRTGTLEHVLTQPVPLWHFVVGKFIGCLFLLAIALTITLPVPATVAVIGDLDWGPVLAGYIATFLMGAAYISIGLFISARSDNQVVSLISSSVLCGVFYLIGTTIITSFFSNTGGEWLRLVGTGARFDAITRGVIDIRDLYYYLSIVMVFLMLNTYQLEKEGWVKGESVSHHKRWRFITLMLIANALGVNLWLGQLNSLRIDTTEGNQYSISDATENYLNQLQEPLLIRGYFSSKTHPLLAPLVPQMRDLIREYEVMGGGKVRIEFIDPIEEPELESEANQKYGIRPVPFQVSDRYQSSIVSSYFNILVQYGDEHQVLGFRDLIEVKARGESELYVKLRNPEHDLTRSIKKVLNAYQTSGNLFDTVKHQLVFNAYLSKDEKLPEQLLNFKNEIQSVIDGYKNDSAGRLTVSMLDPDANDGEIGKQIASDFGFRPMTTNLFSDKSFYFYLTLSAGEQTVKIPLGNLEKQEFEKNLEAGIKRFATGFTKTIALVTPKGEVPTYPQYSTMNAGPRFSELEAMLGNERNITHEDLSDGSVSGDADILMLIAPKNLNEKELFAIDQFLMKGGTVITSTSPYQASFSDGGLSLQRNQSGLENWLKHHGIYIEEKVVLDPQSAVFPIPVTRNISGFQMREMKMLDYPFFVDIRNDGLNENSLITSDLPQATLTWASPISVNNDNQVEREVTELLRTSEDAWLTSSTDIMPRINSQGNDKFIPEGERGSHLLGVINKGKFVSYFSGKSSPLLAKEAEAPNEKANAEPEEALKLGSVIEHSPESARIILFSSNDFLRDKVISMLSSARQSEYLNTLQMFANAVDWSLEDSGLLSIRSRGHFNRTLPPMEQSNQMFWEYLNYGLAAMAIIFIALFERRRRWVKQQQYLAWLS